MTVTDKSVFTRVTGRGDLLRIFNSCVESGKPLMGQTEFGGRFAFRAVFLNGLKLNGELKASQPISLVEGVTVLFTVNEERYLAKTRFDSIEGSQAVLSVDCAIFKLQRRDNFRVTVQQMQGARFEVESINSNPARANLTLIDLSAGGLGAEIGLRTPIQLKTGDIVSGRVLVPGFLNEMLLCEVRYLKPLGSAGSGIRHVGVQFKEMTPAIQSELNVRVLEIHREYFSKLELSRIA
jgi:hypothetical protein